MTLPFQHLLPEKLSGYLFLLLIWLFTGFAFGTIVLLWPLRLWVNYSRGASLSPFIEKAGVVVLIIVVIVASFRISLYFFQLHAVYEKILVSFLSIAIPFMFAAGAVWLLMHPSLVNKGTEQITISERFATGPYPSAERIQQLKKEGFTGVVSLLHPAVVPFEPELLAKEETELKKENLELIKAPMLPWVTDNEASLKIIERLVKQGKGKYYIHCYLGKDRVNMVKNFIFHLTGENSVNDTHGEHSRSFEEMQTFERGNLYRIDSAVYLTPFPTDEEFLAFFLAGKVKAVVNLMDSTIAEDSKPWINREQKILKQNGLIFKNIPVNATTTSKQIQQLVDTILHLPRPLVVHHWNTSSQEVKLFRKEYYLKTNYPQTNLATKISETF